MATDTTSATRGNSVLAAGALMALGVMAAGCQTSSGPMMYAREAHAQQVEAWCYNAIIGHKTESLIQQCVQQAWINVPPGACDINASCPDTGHFGTPYDARRGYSGK